MVCLLAFFGVFAVGCGRKPVPLTGAQVRGITRELVFAAKNASDGAASTGMMPERIGERSACDGGAAWTQ